MSEAGPPLCGGNISMDLEDSQIKELISHTAQQLNLHTTHETKYKIIEVLSASKQVVAGLMYRIKVKIALTDCKNEETQNLETCSIKGDIKEAEIKIWDQAWMPNGRETTVVIDGNEKYTFKTEHPDYVARNNS